MQRIDRQDAFTGTKEVTAPLRIDPARLESYLKREVTGFAGPLTVRQFKGGQSNPTYLLETPSRRYVLRRKPPGKLLPSAHAVDREFKVISALHAQGFPVADPVIYCADEGIAGTAFYVMGFVDGRVFWNPEMPGSFPSERASVYDAMNATIARLHSLDPAKIGLSDFGRGENYVARQVDRWSKQYRASETQNIDAMERLIEWLPAHIPPAGPVRLVHGDYRLDNMILTPRGEVAAVVDWELCTLGDPLADLGLLVVYWTERDDSQAALLTAPTTASGFPSRKEMIARYAATSDRDLSALDVYVAFGYWKLACILEGVYARYAAGAMGDATGFEAFEAQVAALARLAAGTLDRAGIG